jgi:hypothetical protein
MKVRANISGRTSKKFDVIGSSKIIHQSTQFLILIKMIVGVVSLMLLSTSLSSSVSFGNTCEDADAGDDGEDDLFSINVADLPLVLIQ